jgi:hypothetical protein
MLRENRLSHLPELIASIGKQLLVELMDRQSRRLLYRSFHFETEHIHQRELRLIRLSQIYGTRKGELLSLAAVGNEQNLLESLHFICYLL